MSKFSKLVNTPSKFFEDAIKNKKSTFLNTFIKGKKKSIFYKKHDSENIKLSYKEAEDRYAEIYLSSRISELQVVYESFHGKGMSCNPYAIFRYLLNSSEFKELLHIWVINDLNTVPDKYKKLSNVKFVSVHTVEYLKVICESKYLINNTTFPTYFQRKTGQIYLNTWHGVPFKTLGKNMLGEKGQHKNIQRNFLQTTHLVMPNAYTTKKIIYSHDIDNIYKGCVIESGYPRMDLTLNMDTTNFKKYLGIPSEKKVIFFAPTWRGVLGNVNDQVDRIAKDIEEVVSALDDEYVFYFRGHALVKTFIKNRKLSCRILPDHIDSNEFLAITDILISDYSSIIFDFLPLKRCLIIYCHDYESYKRERGSYFELDSLPGEKCFTLTEVIKSIKLCKSISEDDLFQDKLVKFCPLDDGRATERVVRSIFLEDKAWVVPCIQSRKKSLLFYCGGFQNNGITSSAINLINEIDYNKYDVVVVDSGDQNSLRSSNIDRITGSAKFIFRCGSMNITPEEVKKIKSFYVGGYKSNHLQKDIRGIFKREFTRIFGDLIFDVVIDFSGYVKFWTTMFCFATGNSRKVVYQHNDMISESNKKINGIYKHKENLDTIFYIYRYFDHVVSVSKQTMLLNKKGLYEKVGYNFDNFSYVTNCIGLSDILIKSETFKSYDINGEHYFVEDSSNDDSKVLSIKGIPFPEKGKINFITIGRLSPEKRHDKLLYAFKDLAGSYHNACLYIVGSGVLEQELMSLAKNLNIYDKVIFTGQLANPYALLKRCDCFVLSSDHEGQPMVLLEALALNKPIIATNITGSASVLGDKFGVLVDNSSAGLFHGMSDFIKKGVTLNCFDSQAYINDSMSLFYKEVCGEVFMRIPSHG